MHRRATLLLLAAVALPSTPLLAQDQPTASEVTVPPVTLPDPIVTQPPPVTETTPPVSTTTPPPAATAPTPVTEAPAAPERRAATRTARSTARAAPQPRATTPARQAAPAAAAPAAVAAAPAESAPPAAPAPAVTPAPLPVPEEPAAAQSGPSILMLAIGAGLLLLLGFALFSMLRHRRRREAPEEAYHDEPVATGPVHDLHEAPTPMTAAPAAVGAAALAADDRDEPRLAEPVAVGWDSPIDGPTVAPAADDEASPAEEPVAVAEPAAVGWDSPIDGPTVAPVADDEAPLADEPPIYTQPAVAAAAPAAAGAAAVIASDQRSQRREVLSSPLGDVVEPEEFAPAANSEAIAVPEEALVAKADAADAEALAASSTAPDGRPWLEFLMRPVRAGTSKDATVVEFELTVGNTGTAAARDVRISTFMFAAGSAQASEMERMLIDPPADARVTEVDIEAGDATRVEASMALPREPLSGDSVMPVVVADARYRLPDGSEGRTLAQFEVGIPSGDGLDPFPTDRTSGLLEGVEARLHGEPERV